MGYDRRFALGLIAWIAALLLALTGLAVAFSQVGLGATRIVCGLLVIGAGFALWRHIGRTNRELARFIEAIRFGDMTMRLDRRGGTGFDRLGSALDEAMRQRRGDIAKAGSETRFLEALIDDTPVALLTIDEEGRIRLANKAARGLFDRHQGVRAEDFTIYGATFASRLASDIAGRAEILILDFGVRPQRALVRFASLDRLGRTVRAIAVQPMQDMFDAVEVAAQTDLVRVLTHEILNSLTPVTSLASTAAGLLAATDAGDPKVADARIAVETLARRADGLTHFIESYRAVARTPEIARRRFAAAPMAEELAQLFTADWPGVTLKTRIDPPDLAINADPDLLAQVLINLLRNAGDAASAGEGAALVSFTIARTSDDRIRIEVADSGAGVPKGMRGDIFLPFFTTKKNGTGVGLNLARQIVIAHEGSIDLIDAPGGGACFRIVI